MKEGPAAKRWLAGGALALLAGLAILQAAALSGVVAGDDATPAAAESPSATATPPAPAAPPRVAAPRTDRPRESAERPANRRKKTPRQPRTDTDDATRELAKLREENAALRARLDDMLNWVVENLRGRFPLEERQMAHLRVPPMDDTGGVSEDLARLLRLTDGETDRMDDAFEASRETLRELEEEGLSVSVDDAAWQEGLLEATLTFAPYAEDGALVREALYDELRATLGKARFARLLQVSETGLDEALDHFGDRERTLRISTLGFVDDAMLLLVRDEIVTTDPDNPDRQFVRATESIVDELPEEYGRYAALLPSLPPNWEGQ